MKPTGMREACGIFGAFGDPQAAANVYLGLYALQHRGQESAGIAVAGPDGLTLHTGLGLLGEALANIDVAALQGRAAIGHVRYSTQGETVIENAQPFGMRSLDGFLALCHNGNLTNALSLRRRLEAQGAIFRSTVDSEVLLHLIARGGGAKRIDAIVSALRQVSGGYAFLFLTPHALLGARDPNGIRPLCLGRSQTAWYLASESCAFDLIGATYVREVEPGELLVITEAGVKSVRFDDRLSSRGCLFESVYLARPDSLLPSGFAVHSGRRRAGERLAQEAPVDADLVIGVPDSGLSAAMGFAEQSGLPYEMGLMRNRYASRTFIQPSPSLREGKVRLKLTTVPGVLTGKRVVVVDDSIVRGTTSRRIVGLLREAGALEVHMRIASPPVRFPCFYGIDTGDPKELAIAQWGIDGVRERIGADSLAYLSVEGLAWAVSESELAASFCTACFTGVYPTPIEEEIGQSSLQEEGSRR
ncbi:MAG: amidophosphoribosyltransferase [Firmicutes bacterium]|nr:amidophosphoribosyltransferase [Bacillota bacterium]